MEKTTKGLWDALKERVDYYKSKDNHLVFEANKYEEFKEIFIRIYDEIRETYMKNKKSNLDRHKVTAIFIFSVLQSDLIKYDGTLNNRVFLAPEMISLEIGLDWMLPQLNLVLKSKGIETNINDYVFPKAFSCSTPYFQILSRNIYYAFSKHQFFVLDLAEKLFLIEYITLLSLNIPPEYLCDY